MSETGTAVIEKSSEQTERENLFKKWEPTLEKAGADANLRAAIMSRIEAGEEPRGELGQAELRKMSQEEVNRRFQEMTEKPEIRKPEDLYKIDKMIDSITQRVRGALGKEGELVNDSVPPGEVLQNMDSWVDYGWSDKERQEIPKQLIKALPGLELNERQARIIMEILLVKGKKPSDLTEQAIRAQLGLAEQESHDTKNEGNRIPQHIWQESHFNASIAALHLLGVDHKEIQHYILTDEYVKENDNEIDYSPPKNIEDLAWQMMQSPGKGHEGLGVNGKTPLLEMRIEPKRKANGEIERDANDNIVIDQKQSRYRVNTANMVLWARYNMYTAYDLDRETPHNFFQEIALKKRYPLSLQEMLLNPDQYFVSEDGETQYKQLLLEWYKEAAVMTTVRSWDCAYRGVIGDPKELAKVFREMYNTQNLLTRGALGSNIINLMTTMPLEFQGTKDGGWRSDSTMGAAWIDIYRSYDSLSDFDNLQDILGPGSKFFTQKGWEEAIGSVVKSNISATGIDKIRVFTGRKYYEYFDKAFDESGNISTLENRQNFVKFINIFGPKMDSANVEFAVRAALRGAVAEKFGSEVYVTSDDGKRIMKDENGKKITKHAFIAEQGKIGQAIEDRVEDDDSIKIAEAIAWSLARPLGACAKNDPDGIGHDWMSRVYNTELMRRKYQFKGDKMGNEFTMTHFKKTGVDVLNAVVTEAYTEERDEKGNIVYKKDKENNFVLNKRREKIPVTREKTIMEVMIELSKFRTAAINKTKEMEIELAKLMEKDPNSEAAKKLKADIEKHNKSIDQEYQNRAGDMSITQRALSNYWEDHLQFGMEMYEQLVNAKEIEWEKFTEHDVYGGVRFKQAEFQAEVQSELIHKVRYLNETYPSLNFNQTIRVMDQNATHKQHWIGDKDGIKREGEPIYREMKLGEAMFGHEMLNRAEFWKRDEGKPICMLDRKGRKLKGIYEIDYQKVQDNKQLVWKQWVMTKIAGDMHSHRALHANEPRYNFTYYQNAIEVLARMPGQIDQDEYNLKDTRSHKTFFSKADILWLRKTANVENFNLYWTAALKDIFANDKPEEGIGLLLALSLAMKAILEQKV